MKKLLIGVFLLGSALTHSVYSLTLSFTQTGFSDGSTVSGSFTGVDNNNDGWISTDEVTESSTAFFGGSVFGHDFTVISPQPLFSAASHVFNINYDLDGTIGNDAGEFIVAINSLIFHVDLWGVVNFATSPLTLPPSTETFACGADFCSKVDDLSSAPSTLLTNNQLVEVQNVSTQSTLDVDGNANLDALTDGLLFIRHMFGSRGESLIANAVANNCTQCSAAELEPILEQFAVDGTSDIDDNGEVDALTDGLLIIRYLFDIRGDALIDNSVGDGCNRCSVLEIETYLQGLMS